MAQVFGLCPCCLELKPLTKHHIKPKRHFRKQKDPAIFFCCRECHDLIEITISRWERKGEMTIDDYVWIVRKFCLETLLEGG